MAHTPGREFLNLKQDILFDDMNPPDFSNCCSVVILYYPDRNQLERALPGFYRLNDHLIIISNGMHEETMAFARQFMNENPDVHLLINSENRGLGAALNQGCSLAMELGYEWFLLFYQDTIVDPGLYPTLVSTYPALPAPAGLVGCNYYDTERKKYLVPKERGGAFSESTTLITSGSLLSADNYKKAGPFLEKYFIDSIDHEYALRMRRYGKKNYLIHAALMTHRIGGDPGHDDGRRLRFYQSYDHPPFRKYTMARNIVATMKSYFRYEPLWCFKQLLRLIIELSSILIFESNKTQKMSAFFSGTLAGVAGNFSSPVINKHEDS